MEERLDKLLVQRGLISTRTRAEQVINEVGVRVNGTLITKPGKKFPADCSIVLIEEELPWVSRGALKLLEALTAWKIHVAGKVFLDVGASTGGFTEVLLKHDAKKVYALDVGINQLHPRIKNDPRVINLEKTHVRQLTPVLLPEPIDGCVIDVSFISLEKIFPFIHPFLRDNGDVIALIKPQFEVGKENVGKGGIVKNKVALAEALKNIPLQAAENQLRTLAVIDSPILGGDGNKEFLIHLKKNPAQA